MFDPSSGNPCPIPEKCHKPVKYNKDIPAVSRFLIKTSLVQVIPTHVGFAYFEESVLLLKFTAMSLAPSVKCHPPPRQILGLSLNLIFFVVSVDILREKF